MNKVVMEHWDEKCMDHFDDKVHGPLGCKCSWSIVMTGVMEHCDGRGHVEF